MATKDQAGQRISYRRRGELRHGTIVGMETNSLGVSYYVVRADGSDLGHAVLLSETYCPDCTSISPTHAWTPTTTCAPHPSLR